MGKEFEIRHSYIWGKGKDMEKNCASTNILTAVPGEDKNEILRSWNNWRDKFPRIQKR